MKKTLFTNCLSLALCGAMLMTVGCKDYDSDIDSLRGDVEELQGKVVELNKLEGRIAAVEATKAAFDAIDFTQFATKSDFSALETQIKSCVKESELAGKITDAIQTSLSSGALQNSLNSLKADLLAEIAEIYASQSDLEDTQNTLEEMIGLKKDAAGFALEVTQMIESYLAKHGFEAAGGTLTDAQMTQIKTAASKWIADQIKAELEAPNGSINKWLGEELDDYMAEMTLGDNLLGQVSTEAIASVLEELNREASALTAKIKEMIQEVNSTIVISKDNLDAEFKAYLARLEANIGLLSNRIQSIVYVPDYMDGIIYFGDGAQYIELSYTEPEGEVTRATLTKKLYLRPSEEGEQVANLRFRMTPARAVAKYANANAMSLITEEVGTRAAAGFKIKEIKNVNEQTGEFTVVATTDYDYVAADKAGKTQMVALHIDGSKLGEGVQNDFETSFTSSFVATAYSDTGVKIPTTNFVLAKADGTSDKYVVYIDEVENDVKFTDKTAKKVLDGYTVMYKDGEVILPLAKAVAANKWTVDLSAMLSASAEFTYSQEASKANYSVDGEALTFAIVKSDAALISETVTATVSYTLVDKDGYSLLVKDVAKNQFTITPDGTELSTPTANLMWNYTIATTTSVYESKGLKLTADKGMLSAVQYLALKNNGKLTVELYKGTEKVEEDITPSITLSATPTADTDEKTVDLKLTGKLDESATYTVKAVYTNLDRTIVTISIPVTVTGIPEIPTIEQTLALPYNPGSANHVAVAAFRTLLWESLNDTAKQQLGEEAFLALVWKSDRVKDEVGNMATIGATSTNINFVFHKNAKLNVPYTVKNTFTIAEAALEFKSILHVSVVADEIELLRGSSLSDNDQAQAVMKIDGSTLKIDAFDLSKTYYIGADAPAQATVVYTTQTPGAIISGSTLNWGANEELSVAVSAQVMYHGKGLGEAKPFTVLIADPIKDKSIAMKASTLKAKVDAPVTLNVATLLTLKAVNDVNVFDAATAQNTNTAVAAQIEYGQAKVSITDGRVSFDQQTHILTVAAGGDLELMKDIKVTIPVKYTYTFGERTAEITVTVTK